MKTYKLAMVGFGNVGQGFVQALQKKQEFLASEHGVDFQIVAINDMKLGSVYDPKGFSPDELLKAAKGGDLGKLPAEARGWTVEQMIEEAGADALVEVSFTNLQTGEPATGFIRRALNRGMHVVTTNKGPIALSYPELHKLAQAHRCLIGYEGTVMSGTPALALGGDLLAAAGIKRMQGILNGTTNFILTRMDGGGSYQQALAEAQQLGYAEADPTGDVEGHDAAGKVVILANVLLGAKISMADVERQGITKLTPEDIQHAQADSCRWKLIGMVEEKEGKIKASVKPEMVPLSHPLAAVSGATNAITYSTDLLGEVTLVGPGAGRLETGYALLNDLIGIHRRLNR
jgi:homoserine dehydrogenase